MTTKTIRANVTVTVCAPDFRPHEHDTVTGRVLLGTGNHAMLDVPPGEAVTLDSDEADRILARFGGEELADDGTVTLVAKPLPVPPAATV
jgi:hypothetical protein